MSLSIDELAGVYHQAWVDRDPHAIAALHTEDSVFHMHGVTDAAVGRGPVGALVGSLLRLVPDLLFEAKRVYVGTDHIVFEYDMSGTSDGSHFVCDGADVIAVSDGLVARKDTYLDLVALLAQVGTIPPSSSASSKPRNLGGFQMSMRSDSASSASDSQRSSAASTRRWPAASCSPSRTNSL